MRSLSARATALAPSDERPRSVLATILQPVMTLVAVIKRANAERRLREQLATMDDALLIDIGIAPEEIHLIRRQAHFTPRAWVDRAGVGRRINA